MSSGVCESLSLMSDNFVMPSEEHGSGFQQQWDDIQLPLISLFFLLNCFDALKNHIFVIVVRAVLTNHHAVSGVAPPPLDFFSCNIFTLSHFNSLEMQYFSGNNGSHEDNYLLS